MSKKKRVMILFAWGFAERERLLARNKLDNAKLLSLRTKLKNTQYAMPNGWRYPLVGGTRQRHFDGTNFKPRKLPANAQTPTSAP